MLRLLGRRWLGVSGWVYLLSLTLAGVMFWALPVSHILHQWTVEGTALITGFTQNNTVMEVCCYRQKNTVYYHLDIATGGMKRINKTETVNRKERNWSEQMPFELKHTLFGSGSDEFLLVDLRTKALQRIECPEKHVFIEGMYAGSISRFSATQSLETSGLVAMSRNERWLLMQKTSREWWSEIKEWLLEKTSWKWSFFSDGVYRKAVVVDLQKNLFFTFQLDGKDNIEFITHPDSRGFAVIDSQDGLLAASATPNQVTLITWYPLPLVAAWHSLGQWLLIIGCFAVPVLLSMTLHHLRSRRVARTTPVTAPPHP